MNIAKFIRTIFLVEHLWWLLLLRDILQFTNSFLVNNRRLFVVSNLSRESLDYAQRLKDVL